MLRNGAALVLMIVMQYFVNCLQTFEFTSYCLIHFGSSEMTGTSVSKCFLYTFYNNPVPLNGSTQFHYCTDSNLGTGADDAFVLMRGVWHNATLISHSRLAIAASARHFQMFFSPNILTACLFTYSLFT